MEKLFWTSLIVLWTALLGGSAMGSVLAPVHGRLSDTNAVVMPAATVTTPAIGNFLPVRGSTADAGHGPVVVLGGQGGTEMLGGVLSCGLLLRYARRRRLI